MVFAKDEEYKEKGCSEISFFELVRLIEIFRRPHFLYKHTFYLPPPLRLRPSQVQLFVVVR